ncbi:hypothetical protein D3C78_740670 [compost metagenome]
MPAAEHQRAGTIEGIGQVYDLPRHEPGQDRQANQEGEEQRQPGHPCAMPDGDRQGIVGFHLARLEQPQAGDGRNGDDSDLPPCRRHQQHHAGRDQHDGYAWGIRAEVARHAPDRLGDHRDRYHLESVQHAGRNGVAEAGDAQREQDQRYR